VTCPGRTIPEVLACIAAERAAVGLPPTSVRGISGLLDRLSPAEVEQRLAQARQRGHPEGTIVYKRGGSQLVAAAVEAVGIAFSPLAVAPAFAPAFGGTVSLLESLTGFANLAGSIGQAYQAFQRPRITPPAPAFAGGMMQTAFPLAGPIAGGLMRTLPSLGAAGAGAVVGAGVRLGMVGARRLYASAAGYCRRNPGWCASIGGLAAVEGLIRSGQLPPMRGRRGRGITSKEFRSFRRVHGVLAKFCAPKMRIKRSKR